MRQPLSLVHELTDHHRSTADKRSLAAEFSSEFGWRPNDFLESNTTLTTVNLVVEHGLDTAAVISFLSSDYTLRDLQLHDQQAILSLSYNSLVDWHVCIARDSIRYIYNRTNPPSSIHSHELTPNDYSPLTKRVFDQAIGSAPNPNLPALDAALLDTIAKWRRIIRAELGDILDEASLAALFNAIILARGVEDLDSHLQRNQSIPKLNSLIDKSTPNVIDAINDSVLQRTGSVPPETLFSRDLLSVFDGLSRSTSKALIDSFYKHNTVPYEYDFSVISKHSLSKIYERYIAVVQHQDAVQFSLFPSTPEAAWSKQLGSIYTPQYIASFFTKYLQSQVPPRQFETLAVADPACGSGIFLRAVTEQQLVARRDSGELASEGTFSSMLGIDVDPNAVSASRLSLALLHLAAFGNLPVDVPIRQGNSLSLFASGAPMASRDFDAVMVNPPFVRTELQSQEDRDAIARHVGSLARGKLDMYVAFLVLSIRLIRPGGFGFFVVPQPLITSRSLAALREWIRGEAWVRIIADLSAIRIFEASIYVVLLIIQRKPAFGVAAPPVSMILCKRDVGLALEDFLDGKHRQTSSYLIFDAPQESLERSTWSVASPEEARFAARLEALPKLNEVAVIRQGVITGADDVFIVARDDVPAGEEAIYRPFLPDRMIGRFALPLTTGKMVFYPYISGSPVAASEVETGFPLTWARLNSAKDKLRTRAPVRRGNVEWWQPAWPRHPQQILAPKIVAPQVSLVPRFGLDLAGKWIVSHSPFVQARDENADNDLLLILVAILNSSVASWFIDSGARKLRGGYNGLSVSLLRQLPIPALTIVPVSARRHTIDLTLQLVRSPEDNNDVLDLSSSLDEIILRKFYCLSDDEIKILKY